MKLGQKYRITYLGNTLIEFIEAIEKEFGKKLATPLFKFKMLKDDSVFICKQEDIDKAFKFSDWIPVKIDENGNIIDVM